MYQNWHFLISFCRDSFHTMCVLKPLYACNSSIHVSWIKSWCICNIFAEKFDRICVIFPCLQCYVEKFDAICVSVLQKFWCNLYSFSLPAMFLQKNNNLIHFLGLFVESLWCTLHFEVYQFYQCHCCVYFSLFLMLWFSCRWYTWSVPRLIATFWIRWLPSVGKLLVSRWLCWQREAKFGDNMLAFGIQNKIPGQNFSLKRKPRRCKDKPNIWILWRM